MSRVLLSTIAFYQRIASSRSVPRCRYNPTCSHYAYEAIKIHGAFLGAFLATYRILRCNPLSRGGYDPVPPEKFYKLGLW